MLSSARPRSSASPVQLRRHRHHFGANYGYPVLALVCALVIAAVLALVPGYFMIYGRITGVFVRHRDAVRDADLRTFLNQDRRTRMADRHARLNATTA